MVNAPRDKILTLTPEGKRIFAYNDKGQPVCHAIRPGKGGLRCQSIWTKPNGRCKKHGGNSVGGINHWNAQHLRTSINMPGRLQGDMNRAMNDPDHLNLQHEIAVADVHIGLIKESLNNGLDEASWKRLKKLADLLEHTLEEDPEKSEDVCNNIIEVIRGGSKERTNWEEYHKAAESRRRMVDTASKREIQLKQLLKGEQAIAIVTSTASFVREGYAKLINDIEKKYNLVDKETGLEIVHIDNELKNSCLSDIAQKLGSILGKASPPPQYGSTNQDQDQEE